MRKHSRQHRLVLTLDTELVENTPSYYRVPILGSTSALPLMYLCHHLRPLTSEAVRHIFRAGKKFGETYIQALESAIRSLEIEIKIAHIYETQCKDDSTSPTP